MLKDFDKLPKTFGRFVNIHFCIIVSERGDSMTLGQNILNLRKKNGLSQEGLGEIVNVTRQTISNWELGETTPNPEQLKSLSKALNVSVDELVDNDLENVILNKVKITEKQTRTIKKILKGFLIGFITFLVIDIIAFIICFFGHYGPFEETKSESGVSYVKKESV